MSCSISRQPLSWKRRPMSPTEAETRVANGAAKRGMQRVAVRANYVNKLSYGYGYG